MEADDFYEFLASRGVSEDTINYFKAEEVSVSQIQFDIHYCLLTFLHYMVYYTVCSISKVSNYGKSNSMGLNQIPFV